MTRSGLLDLLGTIGENCGYEELLPHSAMIRLEGDPAVRVLELGTLIRLKEKTGTEKDRALLPLLRRTLEERSRCQRRD